VVLGCSGISWSIKLCKQSSPYSRQITTPTPHHSKNAPHQKIKLNKHKTKCFFLEFILFYIVADVHTVEMKWNTCCKQHFVYFVFLLFHVRCADGTGSQTRRHKTRPLVTARQKLKMWRISPRQHTETDNSVEEILSNVFIITILLVNFMPTKIIKIARHLIKLHWLRSHHFIATLNSVS